MELILAKINVQRFLLPCLCPNFEQTKDCSSSYCSHQSYTLCTASGKHLLRTAQTVSNFRSFTWIHCCMASNI